MSRVLLPLLSLLLVVSCHRAETPQKTADTAPALTILAGSENESLQPIIERFARENGTPVSVKYKGSVDIMLALEEPNSDADAVWPAASIWIGMGDAAHKTKYAESIMRSPVVFAVKKSVAQRLGWIGRDVTVNDILTAAEGGKLRYMMTSATQSNSGASAYLGYLNSFAGSPDSLTSEQLKNPELTAKISRLLGTVNRTAGSSGWLKDLFLDKYDQYDGMVNYESVVIETNRELVRRNREPLYVIYPVDGLVIADHPLAYVDRGDAKKEAAFRKLQQYLLSNAVQKEILATGRRVGVAASDATFDRSVFNPDWGIDPARVLSPVHYPSPEVIKEALVLYQTSFRKPSLTVYCLDFSGSMRESGQDDLKGAMKILLDQPTASRFLLQTSARDITIVIPFDDHVLDRWNVSGNDPQQLEGLLSKINAQQAEGGTDIFTPVLEARDLIRNQPNLEGYSSAIILMTDGRSENGMSLDQFRSRWQSAGRDLPIYSITFGSADDSQLKELASLSSGRVFDGRQDLVKAFRQARGYN
jgi:Ca-activated chloride channel family protein